MHCKDLLTEGSMVVGIERQRAEERVNLYRNHGGGLSFNRPNVYPAADVYFGCQRMGSSTRRQPCTGPSCRREEGNRIIRKVTEGNGYLPREAAVHGVGEADQKRGPDGVNPLHLPLHLAAAS